MTRYRTYGRLDDRMQEAGDTGFSALVSRDEDTQLRPGVVTEAKNVRMDDGKVSTRLGHTTQIDLTSTYILDEISNILTTESGDRLSEESDELSEIFSANYFSGIGIVDRNQVLMVQEDKILFWDGLATTQKRFETIYRKDPFLPVYLRFFLSEGQGDFPFTLASRIEAVQFNNKLILLTGKGPTLPVYLDFLLDQGVQKWDGDPLTEFEVDERIPNGDYGVVVGNRLAIQTDNDSISFSDLADETNFDVLNKFTFGAGDGDNVVAVAPIPDDSALVFKRRSIFAISQLTAMALPNASPYVAQVSRQTGCVSRHSVQTVGSGVFFLGDNGVYTLNVGVDASNARGTLTRFDLQDQPLSKPINDQILAEDFTQAEANCRSIFFSNRYYLAFSDEVSSRVYIFNTLMGAWESRDEYNFPITDFVRAKTKSDAKEQLYIVTRAGKLFRMDDGVDDSGTPIEWALDSRAFDNKNLEIKNFRRGYVKLESLDETGTTSLELELTDPDSVSPVPIERPGNEGFIERFTIGKRGNALKYKFSGTGRNSIKHYRTEFIESNNNTISTKE